MRLQGLLEAQVGVIPGTVKKIGQEAFYRCSSLTTLVIPASVTLIGRSAFAFCSGLTSVEIPANLPTISYHAFYKCSGLKEITAFGVKPPTVGTDAFDGLPLQETVVKVPDESVEAYKAAYGWKAFPLLRGINEPESQPIEIQSL